MANVRTTFAKREREQNRDAKARKKQERLAARRAEAQKVKDGTQPADDGAPATDTTTDDT